MDRAARLQALSVFLKSKRTKLTPEAVGLPPGTRRRTPGLRREEVAQLAGVSTTWYTWLEQGRDIRMSAAVLDCIAGALRMTVDERNYLHALALETGSVASGRKEERPEIRPPLRKIMDELRYCPTIVTDRRFDIVGWNDAASHVFLDFDRIPPENRNMIRLLFARQELRRLAVNWEHFVEGFLSIFRAYYGRYAEDRWYDTFLEEMLRDFPEFGPLWQKNEVKTAPEVVIEFRHAKAGNMQFHLTSLQAQGDADLRCSVYTPDPDSATESKLKRLMSRIP